jgi:ATP-binding cassette subfamily B protein
MKSLKIKTVIVIVHRLSTIRKADQIVMMQGGMIVEMGNHDFLLERKGHYYKLVQTQTDLQSSTVPILNKEGIEIITNVQYNDDILNKSTW